MEKWELLEHLGSVGNATAIDVADALGESYAAAAMALLRLARQGLATRSHVSDSAAYAYQLSPRGWERLEFFLRAYPALDTTINSIARPNTSTQSKKGDLLMRQKRLHTGTFHCPQCFIEYALTSEESLACDRCEGPLASGTLDEVWTDDENEEEDDD